MSKKKPKDIMTITDAAAYLGVCRQYLYQCRSKGTGPESTLRIIHGLGKGPSLRVTYEKAALDAWDKARKAKRTAKKSTKRAASSKSARQPDNTMKKAA